MVNYSKIEWDTEVHLFAIEPVDSGPNLVVVTCLAVVIYLAVGTYLVVVTCRAVGTCLVVGTCLAVADIVTTT